MATKIMAAAERKALILDAGAKLGAKHGLANVTRRMVAAQLKITDPLVSHYVGKNDAAIKAYRKRMKELGLTEPAADAIESIGTKLRRRSYSRVETKKATPKLIAPKPKAPAKPKAKVEVKQSVGGKRQHKVVEPKQKKPTEPKLPKLPPAPKASKFAPKAPPPDVAATA